MIYNSLFTYQRRSHNVNTIWLRSVAVLNRLIASIVAMFFVSPFIVLADTNVTTGKAISATGHYHGNISTLVDGAFLPRGTDWRSDGNTVWWTDTYNSGVSYTIDLGAAYTIRVRLNKRQ
jgi:hypothetical protein